MKDGSLELTFQVAGLDEIRQWVMGLSSEAYVVEPKKLRDMVKSDMKKAVAKYEGIKPAYQAPAMLKNRVDYVG